MTIVIDHDENDRDQTRNSALLNPTYDVEAFNARQSLRRTGRGLFRGAESIATAMLRRQMISMVNTGALDLDRTNVLLSSLELAPLSGAQKMAFRVRARVRAWYDGLAGTLAHALVTIADDTSLMRWTTFEGCPEGFGIDQPGPVSPHGVRYCMVYSTLRLVVTVPAFEEEYLERTARGLLHDDLGRLCRVEPVLTSIDAWQDET